VEDELRGALGFNGIVITAPLNEKAVTEYYTSKDAAIAAIKAGADMIYIPENFEEAYAGLLAEVQDGNISEERINESLRRIYSIKYADKVGRISSGG
jgi:beta-N-acetylhexosaminidase